MGGARRWRDGDYLGIGIVLRTFTVLGTEYTFPICLSEILDFINQEEHKDQLSGLNCTQDGT